MTTTATIPSADTGHCIPALARLPAGVTAAIDPTVLRDETPETLDFIARYAAALLVPPLPPLDAVIVLRPAYPDTPGQIYFYCLAPAGMPFDEELAWSRMLCDREQALADTLSNAASDFDEELAWSRMLFDREQALADILSNVASDAEVALLDERIALFYSPFLPAGFASGGLPSWFRHDRR